MEYCEFYLLQHLLFSYFTLHTHFNNIYHFRVENRVGDIDALSVGL